MGHSKGEQTLPPCTIFTLFVLILPLRAQRTQPDHVFALREQASISLTQRHKSWAAVAAFQAADTKKKRRSTGMLVTAYHVQERRSMGLGRGRDTMAPGCSDLYQDPAPSFPGHPALFLFSYSRQQNGWCRSKGTQRQPMR